MLSLTSLNKTISPHTPYCNDKDMVAWGLGTVMEVVAAALVAASHTAVSAANDIVGDKKF